MASISQLFFLFLVLLQTAFALPRMPDEIEGSGMEFDDRERRRIDENAFGEEKELKTLTPNSSELKDVPSSVNISNATEEKTVSKKELEILARRFVTDAPEQDKGSGLEPEGLIDDVTIAIPKDATGPATEFTTSATTKTTTQVTTTTTAVTRKVTRARTTLEDLVGQFATFVPETTTRRTTASTARTVQVWFPQTRRPSRKLRIRRIWSIERRKKLNNGSGKRFLVSHDIVDGKPAIPYRKDATIVDITNGRRVIRGKRDVEHIVLRPIDELEHLLPPRASSYDKFVSRVIPHRRVRNETIHYNEHLLKSRPPKKLVKRDIQPKPSNKDLIETIEKLVAVADKNMISVEGDTRPALERSKVTVFPKLRPTSGGDIVVDSSTKAPSQRPTLTTTEFTVSGNTDRKLEKTTFTASPLLSSSTSRSSRVKPHTGSRTTRIDRFTIPRSSSLLDVSNSSPTTAFPRPFRHSVRRHRGRSPHDGFVRSHGRHHMLKLISLA